MPHYIIIGEGIDVVETLKLLPEMPDPIFIAQAIDQMAQLGRINHAVNPV
jgi:hypothetical protein